MESTENGQHDHVSVARVGGGVGYALLDALVRSGIVEVGDVLSDPRSHLLLGRMSMWSRHSRRTLPMNRSQNAFAFGARTGVLSIRVPHAVATASKLGLNLSSRSRTKKRGPLHHGVALRSCCAVHCALGCRVTLKWTTRRVPRWMRKNAKIGRKKMS
jgi:hypothetical protein